MPLWAGVALAIIGMQVFIIQPGFISALAGARSYDEAALGMIASAEMAGIAAATVFAAAICARVGYRRLAIAAIVLTALANLASIAIVDAGPFAALRVGAGLGSGLLISLGYALVGGAPNPDRWFGYLIMALLTYGALGVFALPALVGAVGVGGMFSVLAVLTLSGLLLRALLPERLDAAQESDENTRPHPSRVAVSLAAVAFYFLGQGAIWAFLSLIGEAGGLPAQKVANALTIAQIAGIAGAFAATYSLRRPFAFLIVGSAATIIPLFFLTGEFSAPAYTINVTIFNCAANLMTPLLIAEVARLRGGPTLVQKAIAVQMICLAAAPAIIGRFIGASGYDVAVVIAGALFVACLGAVVAKYGLLKPTAPTAAESA